MFEIFSLQNQFKYLPGIQRTPQRVRAAQLVVDTPRKVKDDTHINKSLGYILYQSKILPPREHEP